TILESPSTWTGTFLSLVSALPLPSWPWSLAPQLHTDPSDLSASEKSTPAATAVTPEIATAVGVAMYGAGEPTPSWPRSFLPQAQTTPSETASECSEPPAIAVTGLLVL